jgi:hypothetical protein
MNTKVISLIIIIVVIASGLVIAQDSKSKAPAPAHTVSTNYTYDPYSGTVHSGDTPRTPQDGVGMFSTDWGRCGLGEGFRTFTGLCWGYTPIPTRLSIFDVNMDYWFYNGTGVQSRPFASHWSSWFKIRNDGNVAVFERYADAPHVWSGSTNEWNITVRVAVLKHEPVIRVDAWLRILNASSALRNLDINPIFYDPGSSGGTESVDPSRSMGYRYTATWALGVIGAGSGVTNGGNAVVPMDKYQMNMTVRKPSESFHADCLMILAGNVTDLKRLADRLGGMWKHHESSDDMDFVIANNAIRYDCLDYFPSSGYTIYPSESGEKVYAGGSTTTLALRENPIANYRLVPFVTFIDDHQFAVGMNPLDDWSYAMAREYQIPLTLPSLFGPTTTSREIHSWINLSNEQDGTLFEIGDHNYNHTSFYAHQDYSYQLATVGASMSKWHNFTTDIPLISNALAYNAWSYETWDALGNAGIKNLRVVGWQPPRDYNLTRSAIWVTGFQALAVNSPASTSTLRSMLNAGFWMHQGHRTDFNTTSKQGTVEAYWSWVQNQTEILPMTFSEFSDVWHHRIKYDAVDGSGVYNLTTCYVNHRIVLDPINNRLPVLWDVTDNSSAEVEKYDSIRHTMTVIMKAGHVYREIGSFTTPGSSNNITTTNRNLTETATNHVVDYMAPLMLAIAIPIGLIGIAIPTVGFRVR